jgi:hypothetical protein
MLAEECTEVRGYRTAENTVVADATTVFSSPSVNAGVSEKGEIDDEQ